MKYTITVLGQDDPEALRTFIADDASVTIQAVLADGPALQVVVTGNPTSIADLCRELVTAGYATRVTARPHPPIV